MKVAVLQFPGSNCDADAVNAFKFALGVDAELVWHKAESLEGFSAAVVPGGFSYGDYLRCGAIAHFSPIIGALKQFAESGAPVIGICNGFQILCECGMLPGALIRNDCLEFRCKTVELAVEDSTAEFCPAKLGESLYIPLAHGEGNFRIDEAGLEKLNANKQVLFRYKGENPNGSLENIAGIRNEAGNVFGMMPHPERAVGSVHGNQDGIGILKAFLASALATA